MAQIIQIGKRRWLAGLAWSSYESVPAKVELAEDALRFESEWYCVRTNESVVQAGFCAPLEELKYPAGLFSLAAKLADSHEQPWQGVFQLDEDLWWYIAVRDGHAILPNGDVIGSTEEIRQIRAEHEAYGDWKFVEGDSRFLAELIKGIDAKPVRIRVLNGRSFSLKKLVLSAIVLLLLFVGIGGGYYFWQEFKQKEENQIRTAALAKIRAQQAAQQPVADKSPLRDTPLPNTWLQACAAVITPLPLSQMAWKLDQMLCDTENNTVTVIWTRGLGATVADKPDGKVAVDGDKIEQIIPLNLPSDGTENTIDLEEARVWLRGWTQSAGFILNFTEAKVGGMSLLPGAATAAVNSLMNNSAEPLQAAFKLELPISPFSLEIPNIPGLRMTHLESANNNKWLIQGVLYGR